MATWQDVIDLGNRLNDEMANLTRDRAKNADDKELVAQAQEVEAESRDTVNKDTAQIDVDRQTMHSLIDELYATNAAQRARAAARHAA